MVNIHANILQLKNNIGHRSVAFSFNNMLFNQYLYYKVVTVQNRGTMLVIVVSLIGLHTSLNKKINF